MKRAWRAAAGFAAALLLGAGVAVAGARPLAQVRLSSVQAVLADAETVAAAAGRPVRGEEVLAGLLGPLGFHDLSLLDATRPLAVVLPLEGMLLQQRGVVVALPVPAAEPLFAAVAGNFATRGRDGELEVFSDAAGPALYAWARDGYVIAGQTRALVAGFDPALLRTPLDGPPGSVVAELDLESLAPLIQAGLVGLREQLRQQLQRSLSSPGTQDPGAPPVDTAVLAGVLDQVLATVQSLLADLSRVQLGLELRGDHLFWRNRVLVRPDTATAAFLASQGGGLPPLARLVPPGAVSAVAQVQVTSRLRATLGEFSARYLDLVAPLLVGAEPAGAPPATGPAAAQRAELEALLADGLDCYTGEAALGLEFATPGGMSLAEAAGIGDEPRCRDLGRRFAALASTLPPASGGAAPEVAVAAETVRGVAAECFTVDLGRTAAGMDAAGQRLLGALYGGPSLTSYVAARGNVTYYAMGQTARTLLQTMLAAADDPGQGGITAATFAPLAVGPGVTVSLDLPRLLAFSRDLLPADDPGRPRLERAAQRFAAAGPAGRLVAGLHFAPTAATLELALPLGALELARPVPPAPSPKAGLP